MKRYIWKSLDGKWRTIQSYTVDGSDFAQWEMILLGDQESVTEHDSWREAYDAAFIMARKVLTNS